MKRLIGLLLWVACAPAFGADDVSDMALRRAGNESGTLRVLAPVGTASFCRDQPLVAQAVQAHVHGSQQLRLLDCFVLPSVLKAQAEGFQAQLKPLHTVSVHPATLDWAMPAKDFESIVAPPISSTPVEEAAPPGSALKKTVTQWVAPAGGLKYMDCRRITRVYERDGKQTEDKAFTCARYLHIEGWAIVLAQIDAQGGDIETRMPAELEAWATKFAAANAAKPAAAPKK